MPPLTPDDYDPWKLATPEQLLTLCFRLGVSGRDIAQWLRVPPSSVSMWHTGTRDIPPKHIPALRARTRLAFDQAHELNAKARAFAPTEEMRQALLMEFADLWIQWKREVLYSAGTLQRGLQQNYEALGKLIAKGTYTAEDEATMESLLATMQVGIRLICSAQGEVPGPDDALIRRLTEAHEQAAQARESSRAAHQSQEAQ
jgi:hypothetical protein